MFELCHELRSLLFLIESGKSMPKNISRSPGTEIKHYFLMKYRDRQTEKPSSVNRKVKK
ncbi:hypothetical protein VB714_04155 [Spirulina sp. 06S082]|nr:hypothetical protein [Spirulina sp. 06S082]